MRAEPGRTSSPAESALSTARHHPALAGLLPAEAPSIKGALREHLPLAEGASDLAHGSVRERVPELQVDTPDGAGFSIPLLISSRNGTWTFTTLTPE